MTKSMLEVSVTQDVLYKSMSYLFLPFNKVRSVTRSVPDLKSVLSNSDVDHRNVYKVP